MENVRSLYITYGMALVLMVWAPRLLSHRYYVYNASSQNAIVAFWNSHKMGYGLYPGTGIFFDTQAADPSGPMWVYRVPACNKLFREGNQVIYRKTPVANSFTYSKDLVKDSCLDTAPWDFLLMPGAQYCYVVQDEEPHKLKAIAYFDPADAIKAGKMPARIEWKDMNK